MPGSGTETIRVPITNSRDGQKYRCVVTGENGGSVISRVVYLTVGIAEGAPEITVQPEDFTGAAGETAQFTVQASGTGLTYKWQYCNAGIECLERIVHERKRKLQLKRTGHSCERRPEIPLRRYK